MHGGRASENSQCAYERLTTPRLRTSASDSSVATSSVLRQSERQCANEGSHAFCYLTGSDWWIAVLAATTILEAKVLAVWNGGSNAMVAITTVPTPTFTAAQQKQRSYRLQNLYFHALLVLTMDTLNVFIFSDAIPKDARDSSAQPPKLCNDNDYLFIVIHGFTHPASLTELILTQHCKIYFQTTISNTHVTVYE